MVWSESYKHHSIESEVHETHEDEEVEPQELVQLPMESNHRVKQLSVYKCLDCNIYCLYGNLQSII